MYFLYIFLFLTFFSGILQARTSNSMMPKTNPFKKAHKPTARLKFSDVKPDSIQDENKILSGKFRSSATTKKLDDMTLDELRERKNFLANTSNKEIAIKYVEKMMIVCQDHKELKELRIELANLQFDLEDYENAAKTYAEYVASYPNDKLTEFAAFREILSLDLRKNDPQRDQSITKEASLKAKQFLKNENYKTYRKGVFDILRDAYNDLLQNEIEVCTFYINIKRNPRSAEKRLEYIKKELAPYIEGSDKKVKELEDKIQALKNGKIREFNKNCRREVEQSKKLAKQKAKEESKSKQDSTPKKVHRDRF